MLRTSAIAALCTLVLVGVASPAQADPLLRSAQCANADVADLGVADAADAVGCLVNAVRVNAGLRKLREHATLRSGAQARRQLLLTCDVFSHQPCGHRLRDDAGRYATGARSWQVAPRTCSGTWARRPRPARSLSTGSRAPSTAATS